MHRPLWLRLAVALTFVLTAGAVGFAQSQSPEQEETPADVQPEPEIPVDPLGRDTPRGAVSGFLQAAEQLNFERAADFLDLRFLPFRYRDDPPEVIARQVYIVLQRALWVDLNAISNRPEGLTGDGLPVNRDRFGRIERNEGNIDLTIDQIVTADGVNAWVVSGFTVIQLLRVYEDYAYSPVVEWFSQSVPDATVLGIELFKWVIAFTTVLVVYVAMFPVMWLLARIICPPRKSLHRSVRRLLTGPVAAMIGLVAANQVVIDIGLGQTGRRLAQAKTVLIIFSVWIIIALINILVTALSNRLQSKDRAAAIALFRPIATFVKIVVIIGAVLLWLDNIGFNITTLLAGLGIGGVAVALTLQKPLEDLFGALTLYTQQPVRIQDFCRFGDKVGTVEEIGLRTTRIRTLNDTVVSMPNARFASEYIENISARKQIRFYALVRLRLDTTQEQMNTILDGIRSLIESHESTVPESSRARFKELAEFALVVEVHGYIATTDYLEYLRVAEELNLGIIDLVANAGAHFALPMEQFAAAKK